jgi:hypothetical protein
MGRKTRKKYRTSVQQTFCANDRPKGVFKGVAKYLFGLLIRELISEVFHSEGFASVWASIKDLIQWKP